MSLKISTGLANALVATAGLAAALAGAHLYIYAGTEPANADASLPGDAVLLCDVSGPSAAALAWGATPVDGVLSKDAAQAWSGVNAATGTATFFRIALPADTGTSSSTAVRIQGRVAPAGAELNLSSVSLVSGATQTVEFASLAQPLS